MVGVLADLRELRGVSYRELADSSCLSPTTVWRWCTGRGVASLGDVDALAVALDVGADWLAVRLLGEMRPDLAGLPEYRSLVDALEVP